MGQHFSLGQISSDRLRRRGVPEVALTLDSQQHDLSLLDFFEQVTECLDCLSEPEKRTARLHLDVRRLFEDGRLDDVAILNVVFIRDETDEELADRQEDYDCQAAVNLSLKEARDRVEFSRLKQIFEPAMAA